MFGTDARMSGLGRVSLVLLAALMLLPGTASLPLLDRDEPRFSQATVEMIRRGEWVVPYFNDQYRFDKPALTYWLMRGGYALFGLNEVGARAHSILTAGLLAVLLFEMGRRWWGAAAGMAAGLSFLTSLQTLIHGRAAVADMPMVLAVAAAHWAMWNLLAGDGAGPRRGWWWTLWLALGVGFLAKGPVAWLVPAVSAALWRWAFLRRPLPWRRLGAAWGALVTLAVIAPWGLAALWTTGGQFGRVGLGYHVVRRGLEAFDGRPFIPFYYLPTALFSYFPWIAWLGAVIATLRRERSPLNSFLAAWWLSPYLVFFLYSTQLPHYILPGMPAWFLLLGRAADLAGPAVRADLPRWDRIWRRFVVGLGLAAALAAAAGGWWGRNDPVMGPLRPVLWGAAGVVLALLWAGTMFPRPNSIALTGAVALAAGAFAAAARGLRAVVPGPSLGALLASAPPDAEAIWLRYGEPSTVFYTGRTWRDPGGVEAARAAMKRPGPRLVLALAEKLDLDDHLKARLGLRRDDPGRSPATRYDDELRRLDVRGYRRHEVRGLNVANGSWVTLAVFENCLAPPSADAGL